MRTTGFGRVSRALDDREEGSALIEFVFLAVLMLVPIVYLIVALGRIQAGALAVEQGVREAGRAFVTAPGRAVAPARARAAMTLAYRDQGFDPPGPASCRSPAARLPASPATRG